MKHLRLIVCLLVLFAQFASAQNRTVSLSCKDTPLSEVLKAIETQSGYSFFYNDLDFDKTRKVTVKSEGDVLDILEKVFKGTGIKASIMGNNIVLSGLDKKEARQASTAENVRKADDGKVAVSGTVLDAAGSPVPGAGVVCQKERTGAVTDLNGNFSLRCKAGETVRITALGYRDGYIDVKGSGNENLVVTLADDIELLGEIVVVGYGVQKRSDITGAIASVDAERAKNIPTTSVAEMLRGAAPGVQVNIGSAAPGGSSNILIRGRHSLSGDNAPLYVVDGVPMSSIDDINSADISSIEILKDASSQSIYGARAANGVILVTTNRGTAGKLSVSYSGYAAVQTVNRNFEFYNGEEWAAYRHEAFYNGYGYYDEDECFRGYMKEVLESGKWVDWESEMIHPAFQHNHDVSIRSGNDKTKIAATLGYFDQQGMVQNSSYNKISGRLNLDHKLTRTLSLGMNLSYSRGITSSADGSFNSFITSPPLAKIRDEEGTLLEDVTLAGETHNNPLWNIANASSLTKQNRLLLNVFADWKISRDFSYRLNASMSRRDVVSGTYQGTRHTTGRNTHGKASQSRSNNGDYLVENILNFTHDFASGHHVDATAMQSINIIKWDRLAVNATGFSNDDLLYNAIGNALEYGKPEFELSERRLASFLGRVRYNYKDRYLLTAAVRADGSSVFGKNNKWGVFPSVAFAWRMNKEKFMEGTKDVISNLKFRVSYGSVGNQGISPYTTLGNANSYYYEFGSEVENGYLPSTVLYNPDLKWETSTTLDFGIDYGFFKDRINGSIEIYDTQTTDLLVRKSLNQVLGYTSQMVNLGRVQNRGFELALNTTPVSTRHFVWNLDFSYSKNVNKIIRISDEVDENGKPVNDVNNNWFIGQPVNVYYDYKFDGIWQLDDDIANSYMPTAKPGYIKIANTNGDDKISEEDRVIMKRDPDWIGTVSTDLHYKGLELSADLNISMGGYFRNSYLSSFEAGGDLTGKRNGIRRNYWTVYNPSNEAPAPNMQQAPAYITALSYQDASYVRLRNVTLAYNFPAEMIKKISLSSLRVYASCNNVWYHTEVLGYGPEQSPGAYPQPRTFLFGVKLSF